MLAEYIGYFYPNFHIWCRTVWLLNTLHLKSHSGGYFTFLCKKIKYFPAVEIDRSRKKNRSNKLYAKIKLYNLNLKRTELSTEKDTAADFLWLCLCMYCDTSVESKLMYSVSKVCTFHDNSLCLHYNIKNSDL